MGYEPEFVSEKRYGCRCCVFRGPIGMNSTAKMTDRCRSPTPMKNRMMAEMMDEAVIPNHQCSSASAKTMKCGIRQTRAPSFANNDIFVDDCTNPILRDACP